MVADGGRRASCGRGMKHVYVYIRNVYYIYRAHCTCQFKFTERVYATHDGEFGGEERTSEENSLG